MIDLEVDTDKRQKMRKHLARLACVLSISAGTLKGFDVAPRAASVLFILGIVLAVAFAPDPGRKGKRQ